MLARWQLAAQRGLRQFGIGFQEAFVPAVYRTMEGYGPAVFFSGDFIVGKRRVRRHALPVIML